MADRVEGGTRKKKGVSLAPHFAKGTAGAVKKRALVSTTGVYDKKMRDWRWGVRPRPGCEEGLIHLVLQNERLGI